MDAMAAIWWTTAISCSYKESSFDQVSKCKGFHDRLFHVAPDQYISTQEPKLSSLNCCTGRDIPWLGLIWVKVWIVTPCQPITGKIDIDILIIQCTVKANVLRSIQSNLAVF